MEVKIGLPFTHFAHTVAEQPPEKVITADVTSIASVLSDLPEGLVGLVGMAGHKSMPQDRKVGVNRPQFTAEVEKLRVLAGNRFKVVKSWECNIHRSLDALGHYFYWADDHSREYDLRIWSLHQTPECGFARPNGLDHTTAEFVEAYRAVAKIAKEQWLPNVFFGHALFGAREDLESGSDWVADYLKILRIGAEFGIGVEIFIPNHLRHSVKWSEALLCDDLGGLVVFKKRVLAGLADIPVKLSFCLDAHELKDLTCVTAANLALLVSLIADRGIASNFSWWETLNM